MKDMNILYAIDEGKKDYSRYLGISILSLLEHNKDENVHIYILSKYIEKSNKQELIRIVESYGKEITFSEGKIIPDNFMSLLSLKGKWVIATYYRFFFLEKFDIKDRILYLDCDTIVNRNLSEIYSSDFGGNVILGTKDIPQTSFIMDKDFGLKNYINAGVILINIEMFKKYDLFKEILEVKNVYGDPDYNDQGYLNIIFKDKIKINNQLQHLAYYRWMSEHGKRCFVFHTIRRPDKGEYSLCPQMIVDLFNSYLRRTKRASYECNQEILGLSLVQYCGFLYLKCNLFIQYVGYKIFGDWFAYYYCKYSEAFGLALGKFIRKII